MSPIVLEQGLKHPSTPTAHQGLCVIQLQLGVRSGDVVGFHSTHANGGDRGVQLDDSVESETVWYAVDA